MQQWLYLIPVVGALLTLTANIISLATALIVRRDAAQTRKPIPSHPCSPGSATSAEGEAASVTGDAQPTHR